MRSSVIAFLVGILLVQQLAELPSLLWAGCLPVLGYVAWRWPHPGLPLLFLVLGILWASLRAGALLADSLPPSAEGVDLLVEGRIADLPVPGERGVRFTFDIEQAWQQGVAITVPRRVRLSHYGDHEPPQVGDRWRFTIRLKRPHGFQNPGGFDYEAHLLQQQIRATGYVRARPPPVRLEELTESAAWLPGYRLHRFRQQLSERFRQLLAGQRFTAMVTAFANGDDDAIPDDQWTVLNRTGTGHLVAISGMNIGLVAGLVYLLVRWLWAWPAQTPLWVPAPRLAAVAALLAGAGYAALAGFAIPTQRALVMLAVALGCAMLGRKIAGSTVLALALLAVLLFDPLAVLAAGFWLSFAAVAVLLYLVQHGRDAHWGTRLLLWGRVQWAIALGLLPLLLFMFQQVSVSGPVANLLAIPVIELVVIPATLLGVLTSMLLPDSLAAWPLIVATQALELLWPLLVILADWPGALWTQHAPPAWTVPCALVGAAVLLAPRGVPARWLGAVWLLPMLVVRPAGPAPSEAWLTLLDVGQGLSAVVRTAQHTLVYDTGARVNARFDAGRVVLVPFLRHSGIAAVDTLIVSHGDNDHIGGSDSLRAALPVRRVLTSVPERLHAAEACEAGQGWVWDKVRFEILHPAAPDPFRGNDRSCVLRIETPHGRILLPGDIGARAERHLLLTQAQRLPAELLVVPHHGSASSSTPAFIEAVRPRWALLAVGYRNRYRHPHPDVVARYQRLGVALGDTAGGGAIELRLTADEPQLNRYRTTHRRYWQGS